MPSITDPFSGSEFFRAPPERTFAVLTDIDALLRAVPGLASATKTDSRSAECVVKPSLSFISGSVKAKLSITEAEPNSRVKLAVASAGIGMTMNLEAEMALSPKEGGTSLDWTARVVSVTGLIKAAPAGLVRAAADKVIRDGWSALRREIEGKG
jgi:carbon monoxide dehydrogenase subunit G